MAIYTYSWLPVSCIGEWPLTVKNRRGCHSHILLGHPRLHLTTDTPCTLTCGCLCMARRATPGLETPGGATPVAYLGIWGCIWPLTFPCRLICGCPCIARCATPGLETPGGAIPCTTVQGGLPWAAGTGWNWFEPGAAGYTNIVCPCCMAGEATEMVWRAGEPGWPWGGLDNLARGDIGFGCCTMWGEKWNLVMVGEPWGLGEPPLDMGDMGGGGVRVNLAVMAEFVLVRGVELRVILPVLLGPPRGTLLTDVRWSLLGAGDLGVDGDPVNKTYVKGE